MIRSRIIEIDRAFYEAKTEKSHIEIQIPLRIAGDSSDMVKPRDVRVHKRYIVTRFALIRESFPRLGGFFLRCSANKCPRDEGAGDRERCSNHHH